MTTRGLILAAHGSRHAPQVNDAICRLAAEVGVRAGFDEAIAAFHQGDPPFSAAIDQLRADSIVVIPLMMAAGYYAEAVLPRELAQNRRCIDCTVHITAPVGTHPGMVQLAGQRAALLAERFGMKPAATTLCLVGHGTNRHPASHATTLAVVERLADGVVWGEVVPAFLDDSPLIESVSKAWRSPNLLVIPFLIGAGPHTVKDVPRRLGFAPVADRPPFRGEHMGRQIIVDSALGDDPGIADLLVDLATRGGAQTRAARRTVRLGTRSSAMARWQAAHVAGLLGSLGVSAEIVGLTTSGDRDLTRSITDSADDALFTDDIDAALRAGAIDVAVHCVKDMPLEDPADLVIAAILPRSDATESWVARNRVPWHDIPSGSVVGTSSVRRRAQLLAMRPDLRTAPVRGPVDQRVREIQAGRFDAMILATAGLQRLGLESEIGERFALDEILPAPGQGALAIQVRTNDAELRAAVGALDHPPTRAAVIAELSLQRRLADRRDLVLSAFAEVVGDTVQLRARWNAIDGGAVFNAFVEATGAASAAALAESRLRRAAAAAAEQVA